MYIKRLVVFGIICFIPGIVTAASICLSPGTGTVSGMALSQETGNRALWFVGNIAVGEAHCTPLNILTPDNLSDFETFGNRCWCRIIQVAAPNGYLASRSGAWVRLNTSFSGQDACSSGCSLMCAQGFQSKEPFRRVLLVSPYQDIN